MLSSTSAGGEFRVFLLTSAVTECRNVESVDEIMYHLLYREGKMETLNTNPRSVCYHSDTATE